MKKLLLAIFIFLSLQTYAQASLIGDFIYLAHSFPSVDDIVQGNFVTVQAGSGDLSGFGGIYTVNPESDRLIFNFYENFAFNNGSFDGHSVNFIDDNIKNINIQTNIDGWNDSMLAYDAHSAHFNWSGLSVSSDSYFYAYLDLRDPLNQPSPAPEPSTFFLFFIGILGFWGLKKRAIYAIPASR